MFLVALRSRLAKVWVWLVSTAAFSASHLGNVLLGQSLESTLPQVLATFVIGTVFYVLRRVTGSLIPAMLLHGLWDFSIFIQGNGTPSPITQFAGIALFPAALLGLVAVFFVVHNARERTEDSPASPAARLV